MKKLLISTLTALMLVGMVGCTHEVTIKVETPTIETETQEEIQEETKEETQEITEEEIQEETKEETQEITQEEIQEETKEETKEITQEITQEETEEPCVEEPVVEEPVETYKETQENVQYEYNPEWGYDPVFECQYEILPDGSCRYYKLDETTGKYDIVENPEPVDCGIVEKYEPEGYQPIITYERK